MRQTQRNDLEQPDRLKTQTKGPSRSEKQIENKMSID